MTNVFPVSVVPKNQYVAPVTFCAKVFYGKKVIQISFIVLYDQEIVDFFPVL